MRCLRQGVPQSRTTGTDGVGGIRGGATESRAVSRPVRCPPHVTGLGIEDLPSTHRHQQILGERQRRRPADMHAYPDRIVVRQIGRVVAEYARCHRRSETIYDPWHYVPILARKPGALRNRTRFKDWVLPTALSGFGADPPDLVTVTYRWSPRSPRCSRMSCLRSRPSRAGDVGRRPPVRRDYPHPHAPARSRTGGDHLHAICAAAAKGENCSVERIGVQALLHRYRQSYHAFAHITHTLGRVTRTPNNSTIIGSQTPPQSGAVLGLQYGRPPVATHRKKAGSRSSPQGRQEAEET